MDADRQELDYLNVLRAVNEIPFGVGKTLLSDFLIGDEGNDSIKRHRLYKLPSFGSLAYSKEELNGLIERLILNGFLEVVAARDNKFLKLLSMTERGKKELLNPGMYNNNRLRLDSRFKKTEITAEDRLLFAEFGDFLVKFNDEQKKAIVSNGKSVLCIAGAGSGKTTVLTKRIEFLVRYRSVEPSKILAITFTRKARQEMMARLGAIGGLEQVAVETFNSFCERALTRHNDVAYDKKFRVLTYGDRLKIMARALLKMNFSVDDALGIYFTESQKSGKSRDQLISIFVNDCFFIRDYFKAKGWEMRDLFADIDEHKRSSSARLVYFVCNYIGRFMMKHGLRDYTDQIIDALMLFREHAELVPRFEHVLIDEYQDVNSTQIELVDLLKPENIFAVGDPRQSIFGWRGSDIRHILEFEQKYPGCEVIALTKNYRSTEHIVKLINESISKMKLPDLESANAGKMDVALLNFDSELQEYEYAIQKILAAEVPRQEIFVLARTNRQLTELSALMAQRGIKHIVRSDEMRRMVTAGEGEVTLATVHAIKGMEAEMVFVMGCNSQNFPCRGSEHPVIEMIKIDEYDKEEEERRLFYVAMSRAKSSLHLTYSGKSPTYFISSDMMKLIDSGRAAQKKIDRFGVKFTEKASAVAERLRDWRRGTSQAEGRSEFMIIQNKTIEAIAERMPSSVEELEGIFGLGPMKIRKYGEDIINAVNG
jgi:superfamily I DNA/RNA helicase